MNRLAVRIRLLKLMIVLGTVTQVVLEKLLVWQGLRVRKSRVTDTESEDDQSEATACTDNADHSLEILVRFNRSISFGCTGWKYVDLGQRLAEPLIRGLFAQARSKPLGHNLGIDNTGDCVPNCASDIVH